MINFIFDVDGTLTPSRQNIDPEFKDWFTEFCINQNVYLVTGSDYIKTEEQLGHHLLRWPIYVFNCSGSDVWAKGERVESSDWKAPQKLYELMYAWLSASKFPIRTGIHIEERPGMINFSIVGRGADLKQRKEYVKWDIANRERETIAYQIRSEFPKIHASVGGETGIDIYPMGKDKSQIMRFFDDTDVIYFFGDKMGAEGNDKPLADVLKYPSKAFEVRDWQHTKELLVEIIGDKS